MILRVHIVVLVAPLLIACGSGGSSEPANVLLVTLDTTRADRLGIYGYDADTSPRLDELARHARVYERAYSTSSWTLPAHASLFTGEFPTSHGAYLDPGGPLSLRAGVAGPARFAELRVRGLAAAKRTLAEDLRDAGYDTAGVVGGPWLKPVFGLAQGFDYWDDSGVSTVKGASAQSVSDSALAWLDSHQAEPFFLFLNYFDPHLPYTPPPEYTQRHPDRPYDAEIAYMDHQLGRVFDRLRQRGLWDRTLVVVTADHGELFGEHNVVGHNRYLFEPLIRVPLIVKPAGPPAAAVRVSTPTQITEIPRLVFTAAGLDAPTRGSHPIYAEVYPLDAQDHLGHWRAFIAGDYKFLWNSRGAHRLHNLLVDPREAVNLALLDPKQTADMERALDRFRATLPPPPVPDSGAIDEETRRALEALGYLE